MSVNDVSNTNPTGQTGDVPEYLRNASTQHDELSTLLDNFSQNNSNAHYVSKELTEGLKAALETLKNLIDSAAEEALIEELMEKLIALIKGNAQTGAMSIAERATFLSQLKGDFDNYGGNNSEVTNNYDSIVAVLNSDQPITSTQADNLRQALSLSIELENFSSTPHNIDSSLIQALRQGLQEVIGAAGQDDQDKLSQLLGIIRGNSEGAISLAQRSAYIGELTEDYNSSGYGSKLESLYENLKQSLNTFGILTESNARSFVDMLNGLGLNYQQQDNAVKKREQLALSLSTKVLMESNRYKELEIEVKASEALLKQEANPQLKRLRESGVLGNAVQTREEIIEQERIQLEKVASERLAQSIAEAQSQEN
ncbi:MAG: hypothetical protein LBH52_02330 [Puniceicoccales bacterium]|jgi:biotin-(acetyl-CoA carboxylase) ligase|nr:hypothetical protein [Puniceicoccales bacterium]